MPPRGHGIYRDGRRVGSYGSKVQAGVHARRQLAKQLKIPAPDSDNDGGGFFGFAKKVGGAVAGVAGDVLDKVEIPSTSQFRSGSGMKMGKGPTAKQVVTNKRGWNIAGEATGVNAARRIRSGKGTTWDYLDVGLTVAGPVGKAVKGAAVAAKAAKPFGILPYSPGGRYVNVAGEAVFDSNVDALTRAGRLTPLQRKARDRIGGYGGEKVSKTAAHTAHDADNVFEMLGQIGGSTGRVWSALDPYYKRETLDMLGDFTHRIDRGRFNLERKGMQHPANLTLEEFGASPLAMWHSAQPGQFLFGGERASAAHAGSFLTAFDRAMMLTRGEGMPNSMMVPVALKAGRNRILPGYQEDLGQPGREFLQDVAGRVRAKYGEHMPTGVYSPFAQENFWSKEALDPRNRSMMRRIAGEYDVVPYINQVEGAGDVSVAAFQQHNLRTHPEIVRDFMVKTGRKPQGLAGYNPGIQSRLMEQAQIIRKLLNDRDLPAHHKQALLSKLENEFNYDTYADMFSWGDLWSKGRGL